MIEKLYMVEKSLGGGFKIKCSSMLTIYDLSCDNFLGKNKGIAAVPLKAYTMILVSNISHLELL